MNENRTRTKSFNLILLMTFILMIGYVVQRISLTVYLSENGYTINASYSLVTNYISLFAICSLIWSIFNKYLPNYERIIILSVLSISLGLILITLSNENVQLAGISLLIIGGSLYFTFMSLIVNNYFDCPSERQQGNHLYQIMFNLGSLIGVIIIGIAPITNYYLVYRLGALITFIGFYFLFKKRAYVFNVNKDTTINNNKNLIITFLSSFLFIYLAFKFGNFTRMLSIIGFFTGVCYILFLAFKDNNKKYLIFLGMLILCGFPYWLSIAIIYSQFTIFLTHQVDNTFFGITIPPMMVLSLDGIANVLFGYIIYYLYKQKSISPNMLLLLSLFLTASTFLFLIIPFFLSNGFQKISIYWPILSISAYAVAEFLLVTTLNSLVPEVVKDKNKQAVFISMQYLGSASCASLAYCVMQFFYEDNFFETNVIIQDIKLYSLMVGFTLVASFFYLLFNQFKIFRI